jgi:hypothetical protein
MIDMERKLRVTKDYEKGIRGSCLTVRHAPSTTAMILNKNKVKEAVKGAEILEEPISDMEELLTTWRKTSPEVSASQHHGHPSQSKVYV